MEQTISITQLFDDAVPRNRQEQAAWLDQQLTVAIAHARQIKQRSYRLASWIKILTVTFSSAITVMIGLEMSGAMASLQMATLALGGAVTLLNALEPFFNFRALWIEHEAAQAKFQQLKDQLGFVLAGIDPAHISPQSLNQIYLEYQQVWMDLTRTWTQTRRQSTMM